MIAGFFTNLAGTLVPTLLACGITYLLLTTVSERHLAYRTVFFSFLFIWMGSTVIGYIIPANNMVYVVFSFAVLGTLLLLIGRKKEDEVNVKAKDQEPDVPE
jgi:predicted membrane protein